MIVVAKLSVPICLSATWNENKHNVSEILHCSAANTVCVYGKRGGIIAHPDMFELLQHRGHILDTEYSEACLTWPVWARLAELVVQKKCFLGCDFFSVAMLQVTAESTTTITET